MVSHSASEKSPCDSDLRLERRLKRKSVANRSFNRNARENALKVERETDKGKEMLGLVDCGKIPNGIFQDNGYNKSDNDDVEDPQYKMFLENLKENGNSYALVVLSENNEPEVINYDIVDWLPNIVRPETPKVIENCKNNKGKRILREVFDVEIIGGSNDAADLLSEEAGWSERSMRYRARSEKKDILKPSDDVLVKRRKISLAAREDYEGISGGSSWRSGSEANCVVEKEDDSCEEYIRFVKELENSSALKKGSGITSGGFRRRSSAKGNSFVEEEDEEYIRFLNRGFGTTSGGSFAGANSKDNDFGEHQISEPESDGSDDDDDEYMEFVQLLEMKGEEWMYNIGDSPRRFDEVEESQSDTDIVVTDPFGDGNSTPFVSSKPPFIDLENNSLAGDFSTASRAQFRKELIEILKRPYDSKQHDEFMKLVQIRKPVYEEKNLRNQIKIFPSKTKRAKSYLDRHADFAKLVDLAKNDKRKSLNLLRGFFFWLQNIANDGMFPPWKDPLILDVLPHDEHEYVPSSTQCNQI